MNFCKVVNILLIFFSTLLVALIGASAYVVYDRDELDSANENEFRLQTACEESKSVVKRLEDEAEEDGLRREADKNKIEKADEDLIDFESGGKTNWFVWGGVGLLLLSLALMYVFNRKRILAFVSSKLP